jgi:phosphoglycolate phosphatase
MIGDTSFDIAMARAPGVTAIGVTWGYHEPKTFGCGSAHILPLIRWTSSKLVGALA